MSVRFLAALACLAAGSAGAQGVSGSCADLARNAKVAVAFRAGPVATDDSLGIQGLNGLFGKRALDNHNVFGLTHASPYFRFRATAQILVEGDRYCAAPDLEVELGYSEMKVYLARELTDPCRREIVRAHEQEHVDTWTAHLRASAQLLQTALLGELGEVRFYGSREEAEAGIRAWAQERVAPWAARIAASVVEAQRAIDTPTSYAAVASRLRACRTAR
jgi:hypothetical protein